MRKIKRLLFSLLSLSLVCAITLPLVGCALRVSATDLMRGLKKRETEGRAPDESFIHAEWAFALDLLCASAAKDGQNVLLSPLSLSLALAMTANGAEGKTLEEMEALFGGIDIKELNEYLLAYTEALPSGKKYKLSLANSIWIREDESISVLPEFLQTNADYFGADAYNAPFDQSTVDDINHWVEHRTDGTIEKLLDKIPAETVIYLINALVFDSEWNSAYKKGDIRDALFTNGDGTTNTVEMMYSTEDLFLASEEATGFLKSYSGGKYSFAALLPNEGVNLQDYIASLTADSIRSLLAGANAESVSAGLPKFESDTTLELSELLSGLGMSSAFGVNADFSNLAKTTDGNLLLSEILHKTHIEITDKGTKAGAVSSVGVSKMSLEPTPPSHTVILNRPFLYMILDNSTNLPIFIGVVDHIGNAV